MVRSPVVGMISTLMWSFNSASQAYLQVLYSSIRTRMTSSIILRFVLHAPSCVSVSLSFSLFEALIVPMYRPHAKPFCAAQFFPQLVGKTFREAAFYFPDAILLGLVNQNRRAAASPSKTSAS